MTLEKQNLLIEERDKALTELAEIKVRSKYLRIENKVRMADQKTNRLEIEKLHGLISSTIKVLTPSSPSQFAILIDELESALPHDTDFPCESNGTVGQEQLLDMQYKNIELGQRALGLGEKVIELHDRISDLLDENRTLRNKTGER